MRRSSGMFTKGFGQLIESLRKLEEVPQRCVTKAAGKGANVLRRAILGEVPVRSGDLKRGIVRHGERSKYKGKKVYDVYFDPGMNDIFQKKIKKPGAAGGKSGHGYYPASMEFGFLTRSQGGGLSYVPGYHFMRNAAKDSSIPVRETMITTLIAEIDKEWSKK